MVKTTFLAVMLVSTANLVSAMEQDSPKSPKSSTSSSSGKAGEPAIEWAQGILKDWGIFARTMRHYFYVGDTDALNLLSAAYRKVSSCFNNLDDLGGPFKKYGPGFNNWSQMVADAKQNELTPEKQETRLSFKDFRGLAHQAFRAGNVEELENLRKRTWLFNIDDLGEPFFKYGGGMGNWYQVLADAQAIKDAKKNAPTR